MNYKKVRVLKYLLIGLALILNNKIFGQINMNDSTVQVIGYWNKNEKQTYTVSTEKCKIIESDTTSRESSICKVDISIVDSTDTSYLIDWYYYDYKIQSDNELKQKISAIIDDITIRIKTDELGVFIEVINWEDIQEFLYKAISMLREEFKDKSVAENIIKQLEDMYSSKESIEAALIKEIQQFYAFHGAKYKLGEEINLNNKVVNLYGGEPLIQRIYCG